MSSAGFGGGVEWVVMASSESQFVSLEGLLQNLKVPASRDLRFYAVVLWLGVAQEITLA